MTAYVQEIFVQKPRGGGGERWEVSQLAQLYILNAKESTEAETDL